MFRLSLLAAFEMHTTKWIGEQLQKVRLFDLHQPARYFLRAPMIVYVVTRTNKKLENNDESMSHLYDVAMET